jgi:hypothetical protein
MAQRQSLSSPVRVLGGVGEPQPVRGRSVELAADQVVMSRSGTMSSAFPGFAELKHSLRERPQLRGFGVDQVGIQLDWRGGSRRTKK